MAATNSKYVSLVLHRGVEVVLGDYSSCQSVEEACRAINEVAQFYRGLRPGVRGVVDVTGAPADARFMELANRLGKEVFTPKLIRGAIVGVVGYKKVLLRSYNYFTGNGLVPLATRQEAFDYVTEGAQAA